jgi:hypothetical protein
MCTDAPCASGEALKAGLQRDIPNARGARLAVSLLSNHAENRHVILGLNIDRLA